MDVHKGFCTDSMQAQVNTSLHDGRVVVLVAQEKKYASAIHCKVCAQTLLLIGTKARILAHQMTTLPALITWLGGALFYVAVGSQELINVPPTS